MKILGFLRFLRENTDGAKIFMVPKPVFMPIIRHFREEKNAEIRQEYIGGEDFGLHRAGIKHIIAVCDVQRCPKRMYRFDGYRNGRNVAVISIHTLQQKRGQYKSNEGRT